MTLTKIAGVLLALTLVTGSAAALPGAAPAQADEQVSNETAEMDDAENGSEAADRRGPPADVGGDVGPSTDAAGEAGPPADLPEQVPDFVGSIHDLVGDHIAGDLAGDLGERISDVTPDDDDANSTDANTTATPEA